MTSVVIPAMSEGSRGVAPLMTGGEPVPVPARVRRAGLLGVGDQEGLTLGEVIPWRWQRRRPPRPGCRRAASRPAATGAPGEPPGRRAGRRGYQPRQSRRRSQTGPCPLERPGGRGPAGEDGTRRAAAGEGAEAASPAGRGRPRDWPGPAESARLPRAGRRRSQAVRPGVVMRRLRRSGPPGRPSRRRGPGRRRGPPRTRSWPGPAEGRHRRRCSPDPRTRIWIICPVSRISSRSRRV